MAKRMIQEHLYTMSGSPLHPSNLTKCTVSAHFKEVVRKSVVNSYSLTKIIGCARNELFSKSYGAQGSNDATW